MQYDDRKPRPTDPFKMVTEAVDISKTGIGKQMTEFFSSRPGIIFTGLFIGIVAAILTHKGNPLNMGFCVACFERDIAGALNLQTHPGLAYLRPEIFGFILGSSIAAFMFKEFRSRTGSAPVLRFFLGFFAMIGALVFLGCPWRALLRLAGGDPNAIVGIIGLATGVAIGSWFIKNGFNMGRSRKAHSLTGLALPAVALFFVIMIFLEPTHNKVAVFREGGVPHAVAWLSLIIGLSVGFVAQRSRFCTIAGIRDTILIKDYHLLLGVIAVVIGAFLANITIDVMTVGFKDQFNPWEGWTGQPAAHSNGLWNFMGMLLAGLAFALAGGCPGRQLILSGEGDADASIFAIGMLVAAAFSHNFWTVSSGNGVGDWGPQSVIFGLIVCLIIGFAMREK